MGLTVVPELVINGRLVPCSKQSVESLATAVHGFSVNWGRDQYSTPDSEPATAKVAMIDAGNEFAGYIRDRRIIGMTVQIRWRATADNGRRIGPVILFSGRVAQASARPKSMETSDGRRYWAIDITATDRTADLGNAIGGVSTWPAETMTDRIARIRAMGIAAGAGIDAMNFWSGYAAQKVNPLDIKGKSALDMLKSAYESMGNDGFSFDPDRNQTFQAIRLSQPLTVHLGTFDTARGAVVPVPSDIISDGETYPGISLEGCQLAGEPAIHADPSTDINRVECSWHDAVTNNDVTTVKENISIGDARRVQSYESWFSNGLVIDPTIENVYARAREEGARPRHPEISTPWITDFATERQCRWLMQCWENTRPAFIAGNLAFHWLMAGAPQSYSPVVAPIGGQLVFDAARQAWQQRLKVHWIHNTNGQPGGLTWAALEQVKETTSQPDYPWWYPILGIPLPPPVTVGNPIPERYLYWGQPGEPGGNFHFGQSVFWQDLAHVDKGQIKDHLT